MLDNSKAFQQVEADLTVFHFILPLFSLLTKCAIRCELLERKASVMSQFSHLACRLPDKH